ncbi:MAG: DciA family protein [Candidatus Egerieousia sp.]
MKRTNSKILAENLREFFNASPEFRRGLRLGRVLNSWDKAMGPKIAAATISKNYMNGTLYCTIGSSLIRNILIQDKALVIKRVNEACGGDYVKNIVLR